MPQLTIEALPDNDETGDADKDEDSSQHCFPLTAGPLHLCICVLEHDPVH